MTRPEPKKPTQGTGWVALGGINEPRTDDYAELWVNFSSDIQVLSSVHYIAPPEGKGLEYHVSVCRKNPAGIRRPTQAMVRQTKRDFGMEGSDEDNHQPGKARHFWLPCDSTLKAGCDCKASEKPHDEGDGFIWREPPERPNPEMSVTLEKGRPR